MHHSRPFELQPALSNDRLTLRPMQREDFDALYAVASDPLIWAQHPDANRYQKDVFERQFFNPAFSGSGALVVIDNNTHELVGSSRFYDWDAASGEVAVGYTFLARQCWGGPTNTSMKQLMLAHAFQWANTVWFHVGASNFRSRKAVEKLGAVLSHAGQRASNGVMQDTMFYKITQ
jgi:RimJ/RimL family protein N-acetyltransferase